VVWSFASGPDVPSPVTDGTYLYIIRDNGVMWCLDAKSGRAVYGPERLRPATYSGSPVLADGRIYVTNEDGVTVVVKQKQTTEGVTYIRETTAKPEADIMWASAVDAFQVLKTDKC
jgi:outer membrane protein assembly factor BamB